METSAPWNEATAREFRLELARQGMTLSEMARKQPTERSSIWNKLYKNRKISVDDFASMSKALGLQPAEMFRQVEKTVNSADTHSTQRKESAE